MDASAGLTSVLSARDETSRQQHNQRGYSQPAGQHPGAAREHDQADADQGLVCRHARIGLRALLARRLQTIFGLVVEVRRQRSFPGELQVGAEMAHLGGADDGA